MGVLEGYFVHFAAYFVLWFEFCGQVVSTVKSVFMSSKMCNMKVLEQWIWFHEGAPCLSLSLFVCGEEQKQQRSSD